ncbi:TlpA family protein disulfide reductase [Paraferrimonas sedimenticola]|uniref:Alkyl hydroperoxide reductase n=1 Tax=Paraferrimonas sedimenticola TaxID=375674 RepID=A0AA37VZR0_9GAMM|nr:TlpA family protein disulfide reductase [Paraferrimonas sedimenticola]GLP97706.1 alkyl hydroperoxide reductase [Paraferrimonas sedimenticola]
MRLVLFVLMTIVTLASASVTAYPGMQAQKAEKPQPQSTVDRITILKEPFPLESVTFENAKGEPVTLEAFEGKVVMINFWATWCPPCIREIPALKQLDQAVDNQDFVFLPISIDKEGKSKVDEFLKQYQLGEFDSYFDPKMQTGNVFPLDIIPASFILNRKGELVAFARTFIEWDDPKALELIQGYLADKP